MFDLQGIWKGEGAIDYILQGLTGALKLLLSFNEVGAIILVGGNIKGHTRMMTTSIAMLQSMGDYCQVIAICIVLLLISFGINSILYYDQQVN